MTRAWALAGVAGMMLSCGAAWAQGEGQPEAPPAVEWHAVARASSATWSTPAIGKVGALLAGSWKTAAPVSQAYGEAGATTDVVMHVAPVTVADVPDAMYVEIARSDAPFAPYRQAIFQLYEYKGKVRLRTYEFAKAPGRGPAVVGLWAAPAFFPETSRSDLIATLDVELTADGAGFKGKTPYPYPTGVSGAVEMTSELTLTNDTLVSVDRGYDASGKIVWGSKENEKYTFKKFEPLVTARRTDAGLLSIDLVGPTGEGKKIEMSDKVTAHYTGYLADGTKFDSSRDRNQPFQFVQGSLIPGWNDGLIGADTGTRRRLVIPPAQGYGDRGAGRVIPPGATLYFEVEVMGAEKPQLEQPLGTAPETPPPAGKPDQ